MKKKYKTCSATTAKTQTRYVGEKLPLYAKGNVVGVQLGNDASYFGTDMLGSVRSVTDGYGSVKNLREYDVFGNPLETVGYNSGLEYGYAGKPYDAVTEMYNYGFRDYSPNIARFTTLDPVRDGTNWFSYVANDPVNFVDLWGLEVLGRTATNTMSGYTDVKTGNGIEGYTISKTGCMITEMSNVISSVTGKDVSPLDINKDSNNFAKGTDNLLVEKVATDNGLKFDYWTAEKTDLTSKFNELKSSSNQYYVSVQVAWNKAGDLHWVGAEDVITKNGIDYVVISATSDNDKSSGSRKDAGWVELEDGRIAVPMSNASKFYTYEIADVVKTSLTSSSSNSVTTNNCNK